MPSASSPREWRPLPPITTTTPPPAACSWPSPQRCWPSCRSSPPATTAGAASPYSRSPRAYRRCSPPRPEPPNSERNDDMDVATNRPRPGDTVTAPDARIHRIVERLLSQAQQQGRLPACVLQRVGRFPCGNTADYVGPVLLRTHGGHQLEVVVKIDGSPELAREAALLRRAVDDQ